MGDIMLIKDLPKPYKKTSKLYRRFKNKGVLYPDAKKYLVDTYAIASSGDLTLEQYEEVRAYIRSLPSIRQKGKNNQQKIKINEPKRFIFLKRKRRNNQNV